MIIAMTITTSGGRHDDRPWPPAGVPLEVEDWEGEALVAQHNAVDLTGQVTRDQLAPGSRLPETAYITPPAPVSEPALTASGPVREDPPPEPREPPPDDPPGSHPASPPDELLREHLATDDDRQDSPPEPVQDDPPKPADPKQDWIDYAVSQGMGADQAAAMTKADLMSRFGGRL
jgi:hypothetical protein